MSEQRERTPEASKLLCSHDGVEDRSVVRVCPKDKASTARGGLQNISVRKCIRSRLPPPAPTFDFYFLSSFSFLIYRQPLVADNDSFYGYQQLERDGRCQSRQRPSDDPSSPSSDRSCEAASWETRYHLPQLSRKTSFPPPFSRHPPPSRNTGRVKTRPAHHPSRRTGRSGPELHPVRIWR